MYTMMLQRMLVIESQKEIPARLSADSVIKIFKATGSSETLDRFQQFE